MNPEFIHKLTSGHYGSKWTEVPKKIYRKIEKDYGDPKSKTRHEWVTADQEQDRGEHFFGTQIHVPLVLGGMHHSFKAISPNNIIPVQMKLFEIDANGFPTKAILTCPMDSDIYQPDDLAILLKSRNQVLNCLGIAAEACAKRFFICAFSAKCYADPTF
jgi:hypothetical protein